MACQWTDEQTGGHCPTLAEHMTGTDKKWFTFTNGDARGLARPRDLQPLSTTSSSSTWRRQAPDSKRRWSRRARRSRCRRSSGSAGPGGVTAAGDAAGGPDPAAADLCAAPRPPSRRCRQVRVLFDNGAGNSSNPGWPYPAFEQSFSSFPIPGTTARSLVPRRRAAALAEAARHGSRRRRFTWDAHARPADRLHRRHGLRRRTGSGPRRRPTSGRQDPAGSAVAYVTAPLGADTTVVGAGAVDVWVRSSTPNVDLQATISEVRPDGKETFVQGGWVRANEPQARRGQEHRARARAQPAGGGRRADAPDQFVQVTIPLYYEGHVYRAGSRIRVRITRAERRPADLVVRRGRARPARRAWRSATATGCRRGSSSPSCRASTRPRGCRPARACAASPAATTPLSKNQTAPLTLPGLRTRHQQGEVQEAQAQAQAPPGLQRRRRKKHRNGRGTSATSTTAESGGGAPASAPLGRLEALRDVDRLAHDLSPRNS